MSTNHTNHTNGRWAAATRGSLELFVWFVWFVDKWTRRPLRVPFRTRRLLCFPWRLDLSRRRAQRRGLSGEHDQRDVAQGPAQGAG